MTATAPTEAAALRERLREIAPGELFIDGAWRPAQCGRVVDAVDPSTGETITTLAVGSMVDTDAAIEAARRAFDDGPWPRMDPAERGELVARIGQLIAERTEEFALRETADVGKPITPTRSFDVPQAAALFSYYGALARIVQ
jgi:acyl-CoA reductase-like NAD-dependent aldehyde dehydrogenase